MRKQLPVLKYQSEVTAMRRHENLAALSPSRSSSKLTEPDCGRNRPATSPSSVLLPAPEGPQMPLTPRSKRCRTAGESAAPVVEIKFQHEPRPSRRSLRLAMKWLASRAATATRIDSTTRRCVAASPSGTCE